MGLVLAPGHIYLRSGPTSSSTYDSYDRDPDRAVPAPPGIQLLATCKQAYQEGHMLYYSGNIFHLPPGPKEVTRAVLGRFQPKHLALIRHVSFRASSIDLTPALMAIVDSVALTSILYSRESNSRKYARHLLRVLDSEWNWKAWFVATELPLLHSFQIESAQKIAIFEGEPGTLNSPDNIHELEKVLFDVCFAAKNRLFCTVAKSGWQRFTDSWCSDAVQKIESEQYHRHRCISRRT